MVDFLPGTKRTEASYRQDQTPYIRRIPDYSIFFSFTDSRKQQSFNGNEPKCDSEDIRCNHPPPRPSRSGAVVRARRLFRSRLNFAIREGGAAVAVALWPLDLGAEVWLDRKPFRDRARANEDVTSPRGTWNSSGETGSLVINKTRLRSDGKIFRSGFFFIFITFGRCTFYGRRFVKKNAIKKNSR